jgi:hypothetical protein
MAEDGGTGAPFPPINNYKGVMLCDRPSAVDAGSSKPAPFTSAVVPPEQLGLNPTKKVTVHSTTVKEKDTESALYKHKQYLSRLQKDIRAHKDSEANEVAEGGERRKRFIERSAQLRDAIRCGMLGPDREGCEKEPNAPAPVLEPEPLAEPPAEPPAEAPAAPTIPPLNLSKAGPPKADLLQRPAWALNEEEAEEKDALQEEVDIDDLLDFVEGLDFEEYIDDFEVQQALEIMKSRVTRIDTQRSDLPDGEVISRAPIDISKESESWNAATKTADEDGERPHSVDSLQQAGDVLASSRVRGPNSADSPLLVRRWCGAGQCVALFPPQSHCVRVKP